MHQGDGAATERAYSARAAEYTARLGTVAAMDDADIACIAEWAAAVPGPIVDAGSGPGHWTDFLRARGADVFGVDVVDEFVRAARLNFPNSRYLRGDLRSLDTPGGQLSGVLAWYSLIHMTAEARQDALREFARVLRPGGSLLLAGFCGEHDQPFDHAITTAYFWSESEMRVALEAAGFVVQQAETREAHGRRPHIHLIARRRHPALRHARSTTKSSRRSPFRCRAFG